MVAKYDLIFTKSLFVAPLKGIPSRIPSTGFRTSVLTSNTNRLTANRPLSGRKDCAIKIIDINEQPLGYAQAKKRKRMLGMLSADILRKTLRKIVAVTNISFFFL
jgi:hypothetical protein